MINQNYFKKTSENINVENVLLFLLIGLGSFLRLYKLDHKGLWFDEIAEMTVASSNSISDVLLGASHHLAPPLDYLILHMFLHFGNSDFIVRFPSVIFGILSIPLIYKIGKLLFGVKEGLIGAFLLSIAPMHIWYSQETRMYSLFVFLSLLSLLFFIKAINENTVMTWLGFIISTTLNMYTHYFAFFAILIYVLFLVVLVFKNRFFTDKDMFSRHVGKTKLFHFSLSISAIILLYASQISIFLRQTSGLNGILSYGLPPTLYFFEMILYKMGPWNIPGLVAYLGLFVYGLWHIFKTEHRDQITLLALWTIVPIILSFVLTYTRGPMTTERNLIFVLPIFLLLISKGITSIGYSINQRLQSIFRSRFNKDAIVVLLVMLILIISLNNATIDNLYNFQNKGDKDTGAYLTTHVKNDELIVAFGHTVSDIDYYYKGHGDIVLVEKNVMAIETLLNDTSTDNYNTIWFVYSDIDSGMYRGFNSDLSIWLDANCNLQKDGELQNRFSLPNIDKTIQTWLNIEFKDDFQSAALYTFDLKNRSTNR